LARGGSGEEKSNQLLVKTSFSSRKNNLSQQKEKEGIFEKSLKGGVRIFERPSKDKKKVGKIIPRERDGVRVLGSLMGGRTLTGKEIVGVSGGG